MWDDIKRFKPLVYILIVTVFLAMTDVGSLAYAFEAKPAKKESAIQRLGKGIEDVEKLLEEIQTGLEKKKDVSKGLKGLALKRKDLVALDKEIKKELKSTGERLKKKGFSYKIRRRHSRFVAKYNKNITILTNNFNVIGTIKEKEKLKSTVAKTRAHIKKNKYVKKPRPLDPEKLPHRTSKIKPRKPRLSPEKFKKDIEKHSTNTNPSKLQRLAGLTDSLSNLFSTPAYAAEPPLSYDLKETIDAQITQEIRDLAASLEHNPVKIYEYVRNNFVYEPYYGSLKGSQETLLEKAGNDIDLASLLIALYRASNIPAKYVYGVVDIPIEKAMNWVGIKDKRTCANLFATNGIPVISMISGGEIKALRMEHVWVRAYLPYHPYGGRVKEFGEKTWVPLNPSFKQFEYYEDLDVSTEVKFNPDNYLASLNNQPASLIYYDQIREYLITNLPDKNTYEALRGKRLIFEELNILPGSLPYKLILKLDTFSEIPSNLRHKLNLVIPSEDPSSTKPDLFYEFSTPEIAGKRITLSYIPATSSDEAVIQEYGGLYNTPPYLVELKPQLKIEGEVKAIGSPIGFGRGQIFQRVFIAPDGIVLDKLENDIIAGAYYAIGLNLQKIPSELLSQRADKLLSLLEQIDVSGVTAIALSDEEAGELLHVAALSYLLQLDLSDDILAGFTHIVKTRQISEAITSFEVSVTYLFSAPYSVELSGLYIDVKRNIYRPYAASGDISKVKDFMILSGYTSSFLEHSIFEIGANIPSISAVKALQLASEGGIPIFKIDKTNLGEILPTLQVSDEVKNKINNAVNAGKVVTISQSEIQYNNWKGVGYIVMDPDTGAAGYLISGGLAGGSTTGPLSVRELISHASQWSRRHASVCIGSLGHEILSPYYQAQAKGHGCIVGLRLFRMGYVPRVKRTDSKEKFRLEVERPENKIFYFIGHGRFEDLNKNKKFDPGEPISLLLNASWKGPAKDVYVTAGEIAGMTKPQYKFVFLNGCFSAENGAELLSAFTPKAGIGWLKHPITWITPTGGTPATDCFFYGSRFWEYVWEGMTIAKAMQTIKAEYNSKFDSVYPYEDTSINLLDWEK